MTVDPTALETIVKSSVSAELLWPPVSFLIIFEKLFAHSEQSSVESLCEILNYFTWFSQLIDSICCSHWIFHSLFPYAELTQLPSIDVCQKQNTHWTEPFWFFLGYSLLFNPLQTPTDLTCRNLVKTIQKQNTCV